LVALLALSLAPPPLAANPAAPIDDARLLKADSDTANWLTHGRTYDEQRYSPLDQINERSVSRLRLAWSFETGLTRGHEATPIVVDGVMYFTGSWSVVFAVDARSGKQVWKYDPEVPKAYAAKGCCDVVNRGVAIYKGRVFVGTFDGRLVALDAATGKPLWEKITVDQSKPYTITGAPRIVKGKVIIGNGGADLGVRGFVSAYDPGSGNLLWRTYTVPGDPDLPFESEALETAVATWTGKDWWKIGGGGTVWDSMAFDPELDLLYVGTGNGSPWVRHVRSPQGGDNLYLSSILALKPDTGELVWYYQTTPGDTWDFTATQHMILADLTIDGQPRKVIMQAPKNGFFYVLDRQTGKLLSAENYVEVTWAKEISMKTGRPIEVPGQDFKEGLALVKPTAFGGHNWQPMSFNPKTGLVYIPAQEILGAYRREDDFKTTPGHWNTGTDFNVYSLLTPETVAGHLLAWDPVRQKEVWRHGYALPWNGGTLTTAGNLVFQGTADGRFVAYRASDGEQLWEGHGGTGIIAAPVTYKAGGQQYVAVVAGWGGAFGLAGGEAARSANATPGGRLLAFNLGPSSPPSADAVLKLITAKGPAKDGERLYHKYCAVCHGAGGIAGGAGLPDLRLMKQQTLDAFDDIVLKGSLVENGMPAFDQLMTAQDTKLIRRYVDERRKQTLPQ
jgi:quinohemoprotein ethanol dehydrogenase